MSGDPNTTDATPAPAPAKVEYSNATEARKARRKEARMLKRQKIEAAGGKRPRPVKMDASADASANANVNSNTKKPKFELRTKQKNNRNNNNNKDNGTTTTNSRFGRVMEQTPCPNQSRTSTLSIAIPGSIVSNAQTPELRTHLVGQIARAAAIYHVDEIIVFNDQLAKDLKPGFNRHHFRRNRENDDRGNGNNSNDKGGGRRDYNRDNNNNTRDDKDQQNAYRKPQQQASIDPHAFMARILQYCECPQYLRRHFFPMHPDLQFAGVLPPLDAPHHVRALDRSIYREGVVVDKEKMKATNNSHGGGGGGGNYNNNYNYNFSSLESVEGCFVDCGIRGKLVQIDKELSPGIRCTVHIDSKAYGAPGKKYIQGNVVSPSAPREHDGTYWGYTVRMASSIQAIFDEAPYRGGYDFKIGTSERGDFSVDDPAFAQYCRKKCSSSSSSSPTSPSSSSTSSFFHHSIIVFGGVAGIEECVDADESLGLAGNDSRKLFDLWVNVCEYQGSRTIRSEEAVIISLARLRPVLFPYSAATDGKKDVGAGPAKARQPIAPAKPAIEFSDGEPSDEDSDKDSTSASSEED